MPDASFQTWDWVDTGNLSELVASFARIHMLLALFDGDPEKWIRFLQSSGTPAEREHELPFACRLKSRLDAEPEHLERLTCLMREFSRLLGDGSELERAD